ncbi:MAG: hypothetical protein AABW50_01475 [Nanoarchaeota archaeon]
MARKPKFKDSVVKIDSVLNENIEEFISDDENRLKFVSKKHFVDLAIQNFFKKIKEDGDTKNEKH